MKKLLLVAAVGVLAVGLVACSAKKKEDNKINNEVSDAIKFKESYEALNGVKREKDGKIIRSVNIPEDNMVVIKSADELVQMMDNKESFVVYFGFADCPWCRSMVETMVQTAKDNNVSTIYYVDVKEIRNKLELDDNNEVVESTKGSDGYYALLEKLDNVLNVYELSDKDGNVVDTQTKRIYAPNLVAVKDGEALGLVDGTSQLQTDAYEELTPEMISDMSDIMKSLFALVKEDGACDIRGC